MIVSWGINIVKIPENYTGVVFYTIGVYALFINGQQVEARSIWWLREYPNDCVSMKIKLAIMSDVLCL